MVGQKLADRGGVLALQGGHALGEDGIRSVRGGGF
jgi:hypothetical protein